MKIEELGTKKTSPTALLRRIARLLAGILLALMIAFAFFASSFCITLALAAFLSILVDPIVRLLEKVHVPRSIGAFAVIMAGTALAALVVYASWNRINGLVERLPEITERVRAAITPISDKIRQVQESAGSIAGQTTTRRVPEVRIRQADSWPSYLARGVGSVSSAFLIAGIVPFLMFFMLVARDKMTFCVEAMVGKQMDVPGFLARLTHMVRAYTIGNLLIGAFLSGASILVFWKVGLHPAVLLGIVSGMFNVVPFIGVVLALMVPLLAAVLQFTSLTSFVTIAVAVTLLHLIATNFLLPRFIGHRVDIGPVAATIGILFWSWLWGVVGFLLAIPLTALLKLIADSSPRLYYLSIFLAPDPQNGRAFKNASGELELANKAEQR